MVEQRKNCQGCAVPFTIMTEDILFLSRYNLPAPTMCPDCRQQRRAAFRNSRNLYRRSCDFTGKPVVSIYSPDKSYKVYDSGIWWGESWDALDYGRGVDFTRPFFPQFQELMRVVPRPALFNKGSENSNYTNHAVYNKNSYMCFNAGYCEDTLYAGDVAVKCRDCLDLTNVIDGELLFECVDCTKCYNSTNLVRSIGCHDSRFLFDCRGCSDCFLCCNLRDRKYCLANKQLTKSQYEEEIARYEFSSYSVYSDCQEKFRQMISAVAIHPATVRQSAENAEGDYLFQSKNVYSSYDVNSCEDVRYCFDVWDIKDSMDLYQTMDKAEQQYETHASSVSTRAFFCNVSHENSNIQYCDHCFNSSELFGCLSLKRQKYCILNKQYSESDYRELSTRLIDHMKSTGEYGEFFPGELSPFGYNETTANDFYPLTRIEAQSKGYSWSDFELPSPEGGKSCPASDLPDRMDENADFKEKIIACASSGRPFKLTAPEVSLYQRLEVPLPRLHPDVRAKARASLRNSRRIIERACSSCGDLVQSTVAKEQVITLLCEVCYVAAIK